jgi:hypothetical protein
MPYVKGREAAGLPFLSAEPRTVSRTPATVIPTNSHLTKRTFARTGVMLSTATHINHAAAVAQLLDA